MSHDIVRVFDGLSRSGVLAISATQLQVSDGLIKRQYHVDTGLILNGPITEKGAPASNTRVALLNARTLSPVDVIRALDNSYLFRSVAANPGGYFIMGIDLDGVYQPVCQGPLFPVAQ